MAFQIPKSVTLAHAKSKLGTLPEFAKLFDGVEDYQESISNVDENDAKGQMGTINKVKGHADAIKRSLTHLVDSFSKKAKAGTDKEKAAAAAVVTKVKAYMPEFEGGHKLVLNQLLTIDKEVQGRKTWKDFSAGKAPDIAFVENCAKIGVKAGETLSAVVRMAAGNAKKPGGKKDEAKKKIDEAVKLAAKQFVTGGPGYDSFEMAFKTIKTTFSLAKFSPLEAKHRDEFLKSADKNISEAIKRREGFLKLVKESLASIG